MPDDSPMPHETTGVFCLYDLDGEPAYVGETGDLQRRLQEDLKHNPSSVVSADRLDVWELAEADWWSLEGSAEFHPASADRYRRDAKRELVAHFDPYLNVQTDEYEERSPDSLVDPADPHGTVTYLSEEEREFRTRPYVRAKRKLTHINQMVDTIRYIDHYEKVEQALDEHERILNENIDEFLYEQRDDHSLDHFTD